MTHSASGTSPPSVHADPSGETRRWAALVLICLAQFMLILDVTVVNVALPDMAADLNLGRETLTWVVTSYTLCFGGLMVLGGRLADVLGARRTLLIGLALFTVASLACGLADGAMMLLGGRVMQGLGAALLSPSALSIVTTTFTGRERNKALGVWAALGGSGAAVGVLVGGALTDGPGWQWIFYLNVPVGLVVLVALPTVVAARASQPSRLDLPGALLITAGTGALVYGLVEAGDSGWGSLSTLLPLTGAVGIYVMFAAVERASRAPLMDLGMLVRRPVLAGAFLMLVATASLISYFFLGSLYLQHVRHFSPLRTGLVFLPVALATGVGAHVGSRLVGAVGSRTVAVVGLAVAAAGCVPLVRLSDTGSVHTSLLPGFVAASLGVGAVFVTATTTALGMVEHWEAGLVSGVVNTFHEVGGSIGVAVVSTVAASGVQQGSAGGFSDAFRLCAVAAAVGAAVAAVLVPRGKPRMTGGPHVH
ncbi:MFS transporter [Streptomyces werraensis]|uniref:MFS transporter n=1 Tax=Streptomyces werraensis TaxID=68284 RepID=UPI0038073E8E